MGEASFQTHGSTNEPHSKSHDQFKLLAESISALVAEENQSLIPYRDPALPHFRALPGIEQQRVLQCLQDILTVCEAVREEGGPLTHDHRLTWRMLNYLKFKPASDFMVDVETEHIVEIYSIDGKLLFASINFFREVPYSLEDLYCRPWPELYERDPSVLAKIEEALEQIFKHPEKGSQRIKVPMNRVICKQLPNLPAYNVRPFLFSPVSRAGEFAGFLDVFEFGGKLEG